jgi:hypothetical protein
MAEGSGLCHFQVCAARWAGTTQQVNDWKPHTGHSAHMLSSALLLRQPTCAGAGATVRLSAAGSGLDGAAVISTAGQVDCNI